MFCFGWKVSFRAAVVFLSDTASGIGLASATSPLRLLSERNLSAASRRGRSPCCPPALLMRDSAAAVLGPLPPLCATPSVWCIPTPASRTRAADLTCVGGERRDEQGGDGPAETAEPAGAAAAGDGPAADRPHDHGDSRRGGRQEIRWNGPPSSDRGRERRDGRDRDDRPARDERPRERRDGRDDDRRERRRDEGRDRADGRRDDRREERRDDRRDDRRPDRGGEDRRVGSHGGGREDRERDDQRERRSDRDAGAARALANGAPVRTASVAHSYVTAAVALIA